MPSRKADDAPAPEPEDALEISADAFPPTPPARYAIRMLGAFELLRDGVVIDQFGQRRDEELLAFLAYHTPTLVSRTVVASTLWSELSPEAGRRNASLNLFMVRRRLAQHGLVEGVDEVRKLLRINPDIDIDALRFTRLLAAAATTSSPTERLVHLDEAVRLYGAGLLPEYRFDWLQPEQERFRTLHREAVRQLGILTQQDEAMRSVIAALPPTAWEPLKPSRIGGPPSAPSRAEPRGLKRDEIEAIQRFAVDAAAGLASGDRSKWVRRVGEREGDILRTADLLVLDNRADEAVRMVTSLWKYWYLANRPGAGVDAINQVVGMAGDLPKEVAAEADAAVGNLAVSAGRRDEAVRHLERARDHWEATGNEAELVRVEANLARALMGLGHNDEALGHFRRALELVARQDDPAGHARILLNAAINDVVRHDAEGALERLRERREVMARGDAWALSDEADTDAEEAAAQILAGDLASAAELARSALEHYRRAEHPAGSARSEALLGWIAYQRGALDNADEHLQRAVASARASGNAWFIGMTLGYLSVVLEAVGDQRAAATLWDAIAILRATGDTTLLQRLTAELSDMRAGRGGGVGQSGG